MAITRAQQFKQMLREGGRIGFQGGGRDMGKPGQDRPSFQPPGFDLRTQKFKRPDRSDEPSRTKEEVEQSKQAAIAQGRFKKKNPVRKFAEDYTANTRRFLYNAFPNNPRNELDYLKQLPAAQRALLSPALRAKLEELEDAEEFDDYTGFNKKFTFDEFEELRKFQPTEGLNFAEYAAKFKGAPGLLYSGDVGNLEKFVTKRDAEGRPLEYGYRRKTGDDDPSSMESDLEARLRKLEEQRKEVEEPVAKNPLADLFARLMADGGMIEDAPRAGFQRGGRRGDYGQASYTESPSFSKPDDDSPQQTITKTKKPVRTIGDDSDAMRFDKRQLASFGIFGDPKKRLQLAADLRTESQKKLAELFNPDGTPKEGVIGSGSEVGTLPRFLAEDYEINKNILPGSSFSPLDAVNMTIDQYKKVFPELGTVDPIDLIQRFEKGIANPDMEKVSLPMGDPNRMPAAEGGIMDLETGRQMYFLGKLVKKATRAVKKIVKSPIGKAAIGAALFKAGGGFKGLGSLFGKGSFSPFQALIGQGTADVGLGPSRLGRLLGERFVDQSTGELTGLSKILGGGLLTLSPFLFDDNENKNQTIDPALLGERIDIAGLLANPYQATLGTGFRRTAADGGRIGFQEGGIFPRLNQLSGNVSSAEQMLQDINQRLQSAESSLGSGGGASGFANIESAMQPNMSRVPKPTDLNAMIRPGMKYREPENLTVSAIPASGMQLPISRGGPGPDQLSGIAAASYAKGGDVEPVAKKTMPLLDLKGQEMDLRDNGGFVPIGRMEKADDVPARLSKNEFVFTADAVRNAGDGDIDKGAEVMYNMMKNLEDGGNVSEESQGLEGARNMFQTAQRLEEVL